jgi:dihydroxy-acid dehydratase
MPPRVVEGVTDRPDDHAPRGMRRGLTSYGDADFSLYLRKAFIKAMGYSDDALSRPIVGITDTYSAFNPCHRTVPELIGAIERGVMLAGGLPMRFPVVSMHESFSHPTSMYLRNLMSIDVEEMVAAQPMDAVVLIGGCDKTVPALLMGAASADVPAVMTVTGPMMTGDHRGERLGACTDCRRFWARFRAGEIEAAEIDEVEGKLAPTAGTCAVMGTASTMALIAETLGMMLPGGATIPAVFADRLRHAEASGAHAVAIARSRVTPRQVMTPAAFDNAIRVLHAVGGSTNAVIHLTAIAGRLGIPFELDRFDAIGREVPVLVDLKPSGQHYLEDMYRAGGLATLFRELGDLLDSSVRNIDGRTVVQIVADAPPPFPQDVVRSRSAPIHVGGALRVLRGNLAPGGAMIKQSAASPALLRHEGRAVVFETLQDLAERIDDPALDVAADDVLVLRNAGPRGAPGMPEAGYLPIPRKLARQGVKDMVRISDARMSGTAFGTVVLHVTPEAAAGGPLAAVRTGDRIRLDVEAGRIELLVDDATIAERLRGHAPPEHARSGRGYMKLWLKEVTQADRGCDFDFLAGGSSGGR